MEVAKIIGVTESTVWNWEHGTEPELRNMPKIIEFLGYVPFECPYFPCKAKAKLGGAPSSGG